MSHRLFLQGGGVSGIYRIGPRGGSQLRNHLLDDEYCPVPVDSLSLADVSWWPAVMT
jgi:hypothetical protein